MGKENKVVSKYPLKHTNGPEFDHLSAINKKVEKLESLLELAIETIKTQNDKIELLEQNYKSVKNSSECDQQNVSKKVQEELETVKLTMEHMELNFEELQDRVYDIDKSWRNNLILYGVKPDNNSAYENSECIENKVKNIIKTSLNIVRDIPIIRAQRIFNGGAHRGHKPVLVSFMKWSDKEEVLRKCKMSKGSEVNAEEDYSKAAKIRRKELEKFAKEVKSISPDKKCILKEDKLIIESYVFIYNESEDRIERLPHSTSISKRSYSTQKLANNELISENQNLILKKYTSSLSSPNTA